MKKDTFKKRFLHLFLCFFISNALPVSILAQTANAGADQNLCANSSTLAANAPTAGNIGTWTVITGNAVIANSNLANTQVTNLATGATVLRWTICDAGSNCTSDDVSITVFAKPVVNFTAAPLTQMYPDATVHIENLTASGYAKYEWDFGDKKSQISNVLEEFVNHTYDTWGNFQIKLKVFSTHCVDSAMQKIVIIPHPPLILPYFSTKGCAPLTVNLQAQALYADSYRWEIDNPQNFYTTENIKYTFVDAGIHLVKLYASGPSGDIVLRQDTFVVYPTPSVKFTVEPTTVMLPNQPVRCFNDSKGAARYEWDFGGGGGPKVDSTSTDANPVHFYKMEGTYVIKLTAWSNHDCVSTGYSAPITVTAEGFIKFPTAFTPSTSGANGGYYTANDFRNDIFHPISRGVAEYKLNIYNLNGTLIFESNDLQIGWDGYIKDRLAPFDGYMYLVTGKFNNGVIFKQTGSFMLIK